MLWNVQMDCSPDAKGECSQARPEDGNGGAIIRRLEPCWRTLKRRGAEECQHDAAALTAVSGGSLDRCKRQPSKMMYKSTFENV
jgi:hypothetical protein